MDVKPNAFLTTANKSEFYLSCTTCWLCYLFIYYVIILLKNRCDENIKKLSTTYTYSNNYIILWGVSSMFPVFDKFCFLIEHRELEHFHGFAFRQSHVLQFNAICDWPTVTTSHTAHEWYERNSTTVFDTVVIVFKQDQSLNLKRRAILQ